MMFPLEVAMNQPVTVRAVERLGYLGSVLDSLFER
jgi:hypothetical protein